MNTTSNDTPTLDWLCPEKDGGDPGGPDIVSNLFGGKRSCRIDYFVREDLQNHDDALDESKSKQVLVKIHFKKLKRNIFDKYYPPDSFQKNFRESALSNLTGKELKRRTEEIDKLLISKSFPVLIIEDFGTTGLNGPVNSKTPEKDPESPYFHPQNALTCFLRRNGISGKTNKKLGSAGLGRHVYYMASEISSKLVYTLPIDISRRTKANLKAIEPRPIFFGQACLNELMVDKENEVIQGNFYTLSPGKEKEGISSVYMPYGLEENETDLVEEARTDLNLKRRNNEPGTSIVIPFPRQNINAKNLKNTIAKEFAIPILCKRLAVELDGLKIDQDSIVTLSDEKEVNIRNSFLKNAIEIDTDSLLSVEIKELDGPLKHESFPDQDKLKELADNFSNEKLVGISISINYGPDKQDKGTVRVFAQRTPTNYRGKATVARIGLEISKYSDATFRQPWNAFVDVRPDSLGELLRESEDPSHTQWIAADIIDRCPKAEKLVKFVSECHRDFVSILYNLDIEPDNETWSELFPIDGGGAIKNPDLDPDSNERAFSFRMIDNQTARVKASQYLRQATEDTSWNFEIVFDTTRGNRRKAYRPGTIDFQQIDIEVDGGQISNRFENHFEVKITNHKEFCCTIGPCSFPEWADIHLQANRL